MEKKVIHFSYDSTSPKDLGHLKESIKNIAMCNSLDINKKTQENLVRNKRFFEILQIQIADKLALMKHLINGIEKTVDVDQVIEEHENSIKLFMNSSCKLVEYEAIGKLVALGYEVLSLMFSSTNQYFRQQFFHDLMDFYYQEVCRNLKKLNTTTVFEKSEFDMQIKVLLPVIKFESAFQLMQNKDDESQILLQELLSDITLFLKYPRINREDIFVVVANKVCSKKYELFSYEMTPLDERNGHLGDYFKLKITIIFNQTTQVFNLFAKFPTPKLESLKALVKSGPSKKEEFFYMTYLPLLEKYGLKTLLDFCPRCYFSRQDDLLVLDDMGTLGFSGLLPNVKLEFESMKVVVRQIAKFHACNMILEEVLSREKEKKVTLYDVFEEYLQEVVYIPTDEHFLKDTFVGSLKTIHYVVSKFPELTKKFTKDELTEKINKGWELLFEKMNQSDKYKNILCHGDLHVTNLLFKFDSNGICKAASLVDFQILRYCPPAHDLLFFIYENSFKETRDKHYRELIDEYYWVLTQHLQTFGINIADIYPRQDFEGSLKYMKSQAIYLAFYFTRFHMIEPNLREEIFQNEEMAKKYFFDDVKLLADLGLEGDSFKKMVRGLVEDFMELCETGDL